MSIQDALVHLNDALQALTVEVQTRGDRDEQWSDLPVIQSTLAIELERVDRALGPRGKSMFAPIAESIKQAVIAIIAAQNSLKAGGSVNER